MDADLHAQAPPGENAAEEVSALDILKVLEPAAPDDAQDPEITQLITLPRERGRFGWIEKVALVGGLLVVVGVMRKVPLRISTGNAAPREASEVLVTRTPDTPPASPPIVRVEDLPQVPSTGTLHVAVRGHRVFLDGVALYATSALVACGTHVVKIGSQDQGRQVEIPCGGAVALAQ